MSCEQPSAPVGLIISGGQTGVDRAALDVALELGLACGGWCPKGRRAEDGPIPGRYPLKETDSPHYPLRTELNVRDSEATLILNIGPLEGGSAYTVKMAKKHGKRCLIVALDQDPRPERITAWLRAHGIRRLNVAGPREAADAPSLARGPADVQDARMPRRPGMAGSGLDPIGEQKRPGAYAAARAFLARVLRPAGG